MNQAVNRHQNNKPFCVDLGVNELGYHCIELGFTTYFVRDGVISIKDKITRQLKPVEAAVLASKGWIQTNINQVMSKSKSPTPKQHFSEFIRKDDNGDLVVRLGKTIYVFSKEMIYKEDENGNRTKLTLEEDVAKPWIRESLKREEAFQWRKHVAVTLQEYGYSAEEKRAYRRSQKLGYAYR